MSNIRESLDGLMELGGARCAALVDSDSGMILGQSGAADEIEVSAAGNTEVIRAQLKTLTSLDQDESIDDILITLSSTYDIMRPLKSNPTIFLYVTLDKAKANLALARHHVSECEAQLAL
jgi:predicted regulator of Ras-like GTPase activity (Roadblock/LC7/MglB family)